MITYLRFISVVILSALTVRLFYVMILSNGSNYRQYFFVTFQSHAKLRSANACIQADKQFYMAK